jgi:hypothetical protein
MNKTAEGLPQRRPKGAARIIQGLEEALAWSRGDVVAVCVTQVSFPETDASTAYPADTRPVAPPPPER